VDLSALIFVALAVAWAVYLIPKALKHHEVDRVSRSVESFSDRVRVLARREPVSGDAARLVIGRQPRRAPAARVEAADPEPAAEQEREVVAAAPPARTQLRARKIAATRAAQKRRRVLGTILALNVVVAALAALGAVGWVVFAAPAALLVAWLVACRLMVKKERAAAVPVRKRRTTLADEAIAEEDSGDNTEELEAVRVDVAEAPAAPADPDGWDLVPVTLPTYVAKAQAGRTVRTIDLDSTGVWSSGRNAADSALAREAVGQRADEETSEQRRASGA
jgi:hypothetical protein